MLEQFQYVAEHTGVTPKISIPGPSAVHLRIGEDDSHVPAYFFYASRRRHTSCSRDWSSDVCSSDLRTAVSGRDGAVRPKHRLELGQCLQGDGGARSVVDRKSTRLNSSHGYISYAVFCLKKKNKQPRVYSHSKTEDIEIVI